VVQKKASHEGFFTPEELRKLKQKRPDLAQNYQMRSYQPSNFQKAMKDIADINFMIDQL
jgi:hypothetical protein